MTADSFLFKLASYLKYFHDDFAVTSMTIFHVPGGEWCAHVTGSVGNLGDTETRIWLESTIDEWESHQADLGKEMQDNATWDMF